MASSVNESPGGRLSNRQDAATDPTSGSPVGMVVPAGSSQQSGAVGKPTNRGNTRPATQVPHNHLLVWHCDLEESISNARSCRGLHNGLGRGLALCAGGRHILHRSSRTEARLLHHGGSGAAPLVDILQAANWVEPATGKVGVSDACSKGDRPVSGSASRHRL